MNIHRWLTALLGAYSEYTWLFHGFLTFLIAAFLYWLQRKVFKRLLVRCQQTSYVWDDAFVQALFLPVSVLIWLFAITLFGGYTLSDFHYDAWSLLMSRIRVGGASLIFIWFIWRFITQMEFRLVRPVANRKPMDANTVFVVGRFARIGLFIVGVLLLMDDLGIPLTGLLAFGGGGAIVMGIAAQQLLANWFGGVMIFLDKPFRLGDWIRSPDRNIEGKVTFIGWRTTQVMSLDNAPLYIPNAVFNQIVIVNPGRMTHRKIDFMIGVRYDDVAIVKDLVKAIEAMLKQHSKVDHSESFSAHLMNFGASSLDINIACFTRVTSSPQWRDVQQDIFFKVIDLVREHKAEFAFPTVTTHIPDKISIRGDFVHDNNKK